MTTDTDVQYRVTIGQDFDIDDPIAVMGTFEFITVDTRLSSYNARARAYLACTHEDSLGYECSLEPNEHNEDHEFLAHDDVAAFCHFSGGSAAGTRWYPTWVQVPGDHRGDEPDAAAGILLWKDEAEGFSEWMRWQTQETKSSIDATRAMLEDFIRSVLAEYSLWASGETFWYQIEERIVPEYCDTCDSRTNDEWKEVDTCGGFIGWEYAEEIINEELRAAAGLDPDATPPEYERVEKWG